MDPINRDSAVVVPYVNNPAAAQEIQVVAAERRLRSKVVRVVAAVFMAIAIAAAAIFITAGILLTPYAFAGAIACAVVFGVACSKVTRYHSQHFRMRRHHNPHHRGHYVDPRPPVYVERPMGRADLNYPRSVLVERPGPQQARPTVVIPQGNVVPGQDARRHRRNIVVENVNPGPTAVNLEGNVIPGQAGERRLKNRFIESENPRARVTYVPVREVPEQSVERRRTNRFIENEDPRAPRGQDRRVGHRH